MAIITLVEAKKLLQIQDATEDDLLTALIPIMQDFVCAYCNNDFAVVRKNNFYDINNKTYGNKDYSLESYNIAFVAGSDDNSNKIINSDSLFITAGFVENVDIKVQGSLLNYGIYKVTSVTSNQIEVEEQLNNENNNDNYIKISVVSFPKALKIPFVNLLAYELNKQNKQGISSESLGDYSVSFTNDFPKALLSQLIPFKRIG